ncbi:MAG: hypothetical protein K6L73_05300 [Cellvibrionaceae bacterium]
MPPVISRFSAVFKCCCMVSVLAYASLYGQLGVASQVSVEGIGGTAAQADILPSTKVISLGWLVFDSETLKHWRADVDSMDSGVMHIKPLWASQEKGQRKKVFMLLPKKSGSYRLAILKFLEIIQHNDLAADITLVHFDKNTERGISALMKAQAEQADLIFSMGSESTALVNTHFRGNSIPVVASTTKDPVQLGMVDGYTGGSGTNIAYTSLNIPMDVQMNYLLTLRPELKAIGLLYNKNHKQVMATEVVPIKKKFEELGLHVIDMAVSSRSDAKQELQERMPIAMQEMQGVDPGFDNSLLWITSSTAAFSEIATINQFSGNVPVLGSIPNIVTEGQDSAVLAIGIDRRNNAHLASIYAVKILKQQATAGQLDVGVVTPPDIAINFMVAKKIGLKIPFQFFESASFIYNYQGKPARMFGQTVE